MATFDQFIASLEEEFGERGKGKPFEVFCKWFLENDPEWSATIEKVWLWDDYPEKWQRQDLGTDLVFRDNEGLIWAVQAKCYSEHRTTTKGDLNSFLADTGRKEVDKRLWIQTTNKMEAKAKKTIDGQDKPVTVIKLSDFRDAQIEYPENFADIHKAKVKDKPNPDTHQLEAIQAVQEGLQAHDRGQLIMACGTGKTFTTLWIKEALGVETTLVLLPSLSLLSQTMREWAWAKNHHFDILNVCSDKSVGARPKDAEDMLVADASFPVTSDIEAIGRFLKKAGPKVLFCTYQSSDLIAQVQADKSVPAFDLAIADEAHRCAGKADAGFATILDGEKIRATKRLFTTATPRYFGKAIKDEANARTIDVIGMDNEDIFGPVVHKLSFGEAIQRELLTDYQVVIVGVDEPMVKEWIDNYEIVSTSPDKPQDARTLAAKIGLIKAIKDYDLERVISFHSKISRARGFSEELPEIVEMVEVEHRPSGKFLFNYVSGEMAAGDRKEKIEKLKKLEGFERGILTNARCLAEGVDVPSLDGVAFIDPRGSQVDIIQAVGRAIRKVRGAAVQKKGTIVIPVFIEDGDDPEASIEASNFKPVWDVLKALRSHDDDLAEVLDTYRTNMAKNTNQSKEDISDKVIFDLPQSVGAEFVSALRTVIVEATTASWAAWFGLLENYKEREGHCRVQVETIEGGRRLGRWCSQQRSGKINLSAIQIEKLDDIGFSWDPLEDNWDLAASELIEFYENNKHIHPSYNYVTNSGVKLATWKATQIRNKNNLTSKRREKLEALPGWSWNTFFDELWLQRYEALAKYYEVTGSSHPPAKYVDEDGNPIGNWARIQRKHPARLDEGQRRLLREFSDWEKSKSDLLFDEGIKNLKDFIYEYGPAVVEFDYKCRNGFNLGQWVSDVRKKFKNGKLPLDKVELLEKLEGWVWSVQDVRFKENIARLNEYASKYGNANVPQKYISEDGFKLGSWLSGIRQRKEKLPIDRINALELVPGFQWNAKN